MTKKIVRVGSRDSKLAIRQSEMVMEQIAKAHPEISLELVTMKTTGDLILDRRLELVGGKGLFVKELDLALREGRVDITVHSLKDLPMETPEDLPLLAFSARENPLDVLVLPQSESEIGSALGAVIKANSLIGTSSRRRELQLKELYPNWNFESIRGNLQTRLRKLDEGQFDGIILAYAGIARLGMEERISKIFSPDEVIPAAGQGTLVVQGRKGEDYYYLDCIDDKTARIEAEAERCFVSRLDGGCSSPIGAFAEVKGDEILLRGLYCDEKTGRYSKGRISGQVGEGKKLAEQLADRLKKEIGNGKVWLVGAGPGDAGLFTLKGRAVLNEAQVVVYDKLVGEGVLSMIPAGAKQIFVGKVAGNHPVPQEEINEILLREAKAGNRVVRLKGGDPFLFGRGGEELELLVSEGIPFEVVPGVTSAIAVPAYNGIPVTHRDFVSSLHIITGHAKKGSELEIDYDTLVKLKGTLVFLMGVTAMDSICKGLLGAGMNPSMPAAILENGTKAHQRRVVSTLEALPEDAKKAEIGTPAIIVVGEVCSLAEAFSWAEKRPLGGLKIGVTRPKDRPSYLGDQLAFLGAEVLSLPSVETVAIENNQALKKEIARIENYGWVVFTSPAGAKIFFDSLRAESVDIRSLHNIRFAAIGPATAKILEEKGLFVDLIPKVYSGEVLGQALVERIESDSSYCNFPKVLIPRAEIGGEDATSRLSAAGIPYTDLPIYKTFLPGAPADFQVSQLDYVAFTSASTVKGFVQLAGDQDLKDVNAVCIGQRTAEEAEAYGMKIFVSEHADMDSMVACFLNVKAHMGEQQ